MKSEMNDMISIIIPVYNGEKYLRECIESVLNQTYSNVELILVDDKSPDNSIEIEKEYAAAYPDKIKLIALDENKGTGNALNRGIDAAQGVLAVFRR
ncbi:MAG: glycosyltransferase [Ruminococcus flavefaciens]|nr:glycosyltransferase [Ruminococcus flavefaciens]